MTLRSLLFLALACIVPICAAEVDFRSELGASGVLGIAGQRDGKLILAGYFDGITAPGGYTILRLNAEGSLDTNFQRVRIAGDYSYTVGPIALQSNEKVLVGGSFFTAAGVPRTNLVRLDTNGFVDLSFNANQALSGSDVIHDIVPLNDGRILVAGRISAEGIPVLLGKRASHQDFSVFQPPDDDCSSLDRRVEISIVTSIRAKPRQRRNFWRFKAAAGYRERARSQEASVLEQFQVVNSNRAQT